MESDSDWGPGAKQLWVGKRRLRRVAVVALDVPPEEAAAALRSLAVDVVTTVSGSDWASLKSLRKFLARKQIDGIVAYAGDCSRLSYPDLYGAALTVIAGGSSWLLADGGTRRITRCGGIHTASMIARLAVAAGHTSRMVYLARREVRSSPTKPRTLSGPSHSNMSVDPKWVLIVWHGSPSAEGGAVTHLKGILRGFRSRGYRIGLVSTFPLPPTIQDNVEQFILTDPLPVSDRVTRDTARIAADVQIATECRTFVALRQPQLIYQRHAYQSIAGATVANEAGVPFVLEWNYSELWVKRNWWTRDPLSFLSKKFERLAEVREAQALATASVVAAVSAAAADTAKELGAGPQRVLTVPNAVDLADVPEPRALPNRAQDALLGWVGTFGPWHGAEVAVKALAQLPESVRLLMIGDGSQRQVCERIAAELGVNDRIEFTGALPKPDVTARLQNCDVLISPHVPVGDVPFFGSPTKIFDYMAIGRPIVASRLEQIGEVLTDGRTAHLVEPGDAAGLAKGVLDVLSSGDRGAGLGRAARQEAKERHDWGMRVDQILDALRD